ncbi:MAG: hypothetical protein KTR35_07305 [Gammaproteobacteria bacterium]|nr:hypothetical protein [Gammaproteobacteria bacterium]
MIQVSIPSSRLRRWLQIGLISSSVLLLTACSSGSDDSDDIEGGEQALPGNTTTTAIGDVFTFGAANRTLYTFANDVSGQSNCNDGCAIDWPPIEAQSEATVGEFSTIVRNDSSLQWAYKDSPLYYYAGDAAEGEVNGEGLGMVWYVARPNPVETGTTDLGEVLVGKGSISTGTDDPSLRSEFNGRTLYTFANDTADTSNCNDACATNWPPLYADKGARSSNGYSVITRSDGSRQWSYNTQPLYFFTGDAAAGDTTGEGVGGVWSVARP